MDNSRGSIAFFGTYRPPVPLDIFARPATPPATAVDDQPLLDGVSYNHNGRPIPPAALKEMLTFLGKKNPSLASQTGYTADDVVKGAVTGLAFISERDNGLETIHVALVGDKQQPAKVLRLADIYGEDTFGGVRMEDSPCFGGGFSAGGRTVDQSIVYVSTKDPVKIRRTPWTVVYKTSLVDGKTERLTPPDQYDLSPAVSPSGKMVAVANFQFHKWNADIMHINTDIVVMNFDRDAQGGLGRKIVVRNGGWPSWGSDNVLFFHRGIDYVDPVTKRPNTKWGVHRYDLRTKQTVQVTPDTFDAMTPAAIDENKVVVATLRQSSLLAVATVPRVPAQYRHIEIYDATAGQNAVAEVTLSQMAKADHYSPFVLDAGKRIGYHRCRMDSMIQYNGTDVVPKAFNKLLTPDTHKDVGLYRVSGVFPSINKDGSKIAFVDNEFKAVWVADKKGLRVVYEEKNSNRVFSTSWNQNPDLDTLYVCIGPAFNRMKELDIYALKGVSTTKRPSKHRLTAGGFNNAFPSSSPDGTRLVFRSTCDREGTKDDRQYKNLWIMEDTDVGEFDDGEVTRLTKGNWVDTHCSWSPSGDWIVFSSSRNKAPDARPILDDGCFAVYLVSAKDINPGEVPVPVLVVQSSATFAGHINHPVFSPDMRSIVFTSDLAAVSTEPIAMPVFVHSVRPYGDIFSVDLRDKDDITKNSDITEYHRITHSRYEYSTPAWTKFATIDPNTQWSMVHTGSEFKPACPYMYSDGGEGWHMAGHLTFDRRCC